MSKYPVIIGRAEGIDISGVVLNVPAKIDSGAFRSSIHCKSVKEVSKGDTKILKVTLLGHPCAPVEYPMEFTDYEKVNITNSFGHEEERFEVKLKIKLGPKIFSSSFTLADRANNLFPVLVGRKLLKGRYMVDVSKSSIDRLALKKEFGITTPIDEEDAED